MAEGRELAAKQLQFFLLLIRTNIRASFALRRAFFLQAGLMLANNLIFFAFWLIFFRQFPSIKGWKLPDIALLGGIVTGAYGLTVVIFGGIRHLSRIIDEGQLDGLLTQPQSVLMQALISRSSVSGWGDILTSIILLGSTGFLRPPLIFLVLPLMISSMIILLSSGIILSSTSFWWRRMDGITRQWIDFLIAFASYPQNIFAGSVRWVLFTILPAGFMGYLPTQILRQWDSRLFFIQIAATVIYGGLAVWLFNRGLRNYQSGNRFTLRV